MHIRESVELSAFVVTEKDALLSPANGISTRALTQYWTASRCRIDRWARVLQLARRPSMLNICRFRNIILAIAEEIIIGEMLARVWAAALTIYDAACGSPEYQPVAINVLGRHLEISNCLLRILADDGVFSPTERQALQRLSRSTERWTDLLLGHLGAPERTMAFVHEADCVADFADDLTREQPASLHCQKWSLIHSSMRASYKEPLSDCSANPDLNSRIASSILACFPVEAFDTSLTYHTLWLHWLSMSALEMQNLVAELLEDGLRQ